MNVALELLVPVFFFKIHFIKAFNLLSLLGCFSAIEKYRVQSNNYGITML